MLANDLFNRAYQVVSDITYKDGYEIVVFSNYGAVVIAVGQFNDYEGYQQGRKWLLEDEMTDTEIVLTALKAVITFEEHEAREAFRYKGARIFGPHLDLDALREFAKKKENLSLRTA